MLSAWKPFYFDVGPWPRLVRGPADWTDVVRGIADLDAALTARSDGGLPTFGFGPRHVGPSLRAWAVAQGIALGEQETVAESSQLAERIRVRFLRAEPNQ